MYSNHTYQEETPIEHHPCAYVDYSGGPVDNPGSPIDDPESSIDDPGGSFHVSLSLSYQSCPEAPSVGCLGREV